MESKPLSLRTRLTTTLFAPVDAASVVAFRILFYAIVAWQAWRFIESYWVEMYFSNKEFYFTYWPFDFVHPWPGGGMSIHLWVLIGVALCAMCGVFYRFSTTACFLLFTYVFLLEKARYINHVYLTCLLTFVMIFLPVHRTWSFDAWRRQSLRSEVVPAWTLWLLQLQIGIPYFFGGIAKLNADWLQCEPLRAWLAERTSFPLIGPYFTNEPVVWFMTYSSLLLDLLAVFLLLNRRTRVFWYIGLLAFHFMNSRLFGIGIFPWLMIPATLIFFEADWPRRIWRDIQGGTSVRIPRLIVGAALGCVIGAVLPGYFSIARALIGALGGAIAGYFLDEPFDADWKSADRSIETEQAISGELFSIKSWILAFLSIWVAIQLLLPLRHFFIPGNVHWTEEGHNYSWHMKLRAKVSEGVFNIKDTKTGEEWTVQPREHLTQVQERKMTARPHMIVQFAHYLAEHYGQERQAEVEVRARITASLNGRAPQLLIDPEVNLSKVPYPWWGHAEWILPLEVPLETAWEKEALPPNS
jgi:vitamin K-dependent gamma-carboxylase